MKKRLLIIGFLIIGIIFFPIVYNLITIKSRVYYVITHDVQGTYREEIINKIELLNYTIYLNNYYEGYGEYKSYIDRDFVLYLQSRIENDTYFHWELFYSHYLKYSFIANNHTGLYLTYSNNTIFSVKDQNNQSLLIVENYNWNEVAWYLNFTQLAYVYGDNNTILLNNAFFIELYLDYGYYCGSLCGLWYSLDQYIVLTTNLHALMIFIPHTGVLVS